MKTQTDALVLKVTDTGESDRLLTLFSPEYGVIRAFANGAKRMNSRLSCVSQSLTYGTYDLTLGKSGNTVTAGAEKQIFFELRNDISKLALSQYISSIIIDTVGENEECGELFRTVLNALYFLEKNLKPQSIIKSVIEIKALCFSGYAPSLDCCPHCGITQGSNMRFNIAEGSLYCENSGKKGELLTPGVLAAMRFICYAPVERIFSFTLSEKDETSLSFLTEKYLLYSLQKEYKTLDFYKVML